MFMELHIGNLENTYSFLNNLQNMHLFPNEDIDDEKFKVKTDTKKLVEKLRLAGSLGYNNVEMPYPLNFASFFIRRIGDIYSAALFIGARNVKESFFNLSGRLKKSYNEKSLDFIQTTARGTGYIIEQNNLVDERQVDYCIAEDNPFVRAIWIGSKGAVLRVFPEEEKIFINEVRGLEDIANSFIKTIYGFNEIKTAGITLEINP